MFDRAYIATINDRPIAAFPTFGDAYNLVAEVKLEEGVAEVKSCPMFMSWKTLDGMAEEVPDGTDG